MEEASLSNPAIVSNVNFVHIIAMQDCVVTDVDVAA
jgi:hypothetical protein